jgi:hypothetical protein
MKQEKKDTETDRKIRKEKEGEKQYGNEGRKITQRKKKNYEKSI